MPTISKVRIVNFLFNNGHRLIPDELFDLSEEGGRGLDTLISLVNGGGKSVMTQLMLLPVYPRARVANRKIEDYFQRSSDHCFVLLEWHKDNSQEKLLTGIAMASSAIQDSDGSGSKRIRYYTFCTEYLPGNCRYSINELELSKNENGKFVPAEFEFIRKNFKKEMEIYSSDSNASWRKKLSEYGIYQDEWRRVLEPLNIMEGGMTKYFEDLKRSDQVIDKMLIPAIEMRFSGGQSTADNSLADLLVKYVHQYVKKEEMIEEEKICVKFIDDMKELHEKAENLWTLNDNVESEQSQMFGFLAALTEAINRMDTEKESAEQVIADIEAQLHHIRHEEVSKKYYDAYSILTDAENHYNETVKNKEQTEKTLFNTELSWRIQQAARWFMKFSEKDGQVKALEQQLHDSENSEQSKRIDEIGKRTFAAVSGEIDSCETRLSEAMQQKDALDKRKCQAQEIYESAVKKESAAKTAKDKSEEAFQTAQNETERLIKNLGIEVQRNLTGCYDMKEIHHAAENNHEKIRKLTEQKHTIQQQMCGMNERKEAIPSEEAERKAEIKELEREWKEAIQEKDTYLGIEERIGLICQEHTLDFSQRFGAGIKDYLTEQIADVNAELSRLNSLLNLKEKEIAASENGTVHIPMEVIEYLDRIGIRYKTCEAYFLEQINRGMVTSEKCLELLQNCPSAAYGIMIDEEQKRFIEDARADWLPAAIPIFTPSRMDRVLNGTYQEKELLACYSVLSFKDRTTYIHSLCSKKEEFREQYQQSQKKLSVLEEQLTVAKSFTYVSDWLTRQENRISHILEEKEKINVTISALQGEKKEIESELKRLSEELNTINRSIQQLEKWADSYSELLNRLNGEKKCMDRYNAAGSLFKTAERERKSANEQLERITHELSAVSEQIKEWKVQKKELLQVRSQVERYDNDSKSEENWRELLEQFSILLSTQNSAVQDLQERLRNTQKSREDYFELLASTNCTEEQYKSVIYSEEKIKDLEHKIEELKKKKSDCDEKEKECLEIKTEAKTRFARLQEDVGKFGGVLPKNEVKSDFERRTEILNNKIAVEKENLKALENRRQQFEQTDFRIGAVLENIPKPDKVSLVSINADTQKQWNEMYGKYNELEKTMKTQETNFINIVSEFYDNRYKGTSQGMTLKIIKEMLTSSNDGGDIYYTIAEGIEEGTNTAKKQIAKIKTDLNDFEGMKHNLIIQCITQGREMYKGLKEMQKNSGVKIYEGKQQKEMIRFVMPSDIDEHSAYMRLEQELEKCTREIAAKLSEGKQEGAVKGYAESAMSSAVLLRKYIGSEHITLKAFKADIYPENAEYKTWEETRVQNSGSEEFLVYLAVILAVMNYTRRNGTMIGSGSGVLILDNPFGAISTKEKLVPMFEMAKNVRVQLICLSDITKCDITSCFNNVIRAAVKSNSFSSVSFLIHEGKERIEHGYYRSQQMKLL